jgi:hypothetical protein
MIDTKPYEHVYPQSTLNYLQTIQLPKPANWQASLTPGGYVKFRPTEGNVPCWFHRQMQRLCFGFVWERLT